MQTIGERLLEARQRRGVSIREAAEATKVRGDYLAAMENNLFDSIPLADVYRRGFLKIYARFLRLDSDRVVGDFNALLAARSPASGRVRRPHPEHLDPGSRPPESRKDVEALDEFSSGAIEVAERPEGRRKTFLIVGGVALSLVTLVALVSLFSGQENSAAKSNPAVVVADANGGTVVFSGDAGAAVRLTVLRKGAAASDSPLVDQLIESGKTVTLTVSGAVVVKASPISKLRFSVNGGGASWFPSGESMGFGELTVAPAKGR